MVRTKKRTIPNTFSISLLFFFLISFSFLVNSVYFEPPSKDQLRDSFKKLNIEFKENDLDFYTSEEYIVLNITYNNPKQLEKIRETIGPYGISLQYTNVSYLLLSVRKVHFWSLVDLKEAGIGRITLLDQNVVKYLKSELGDLLKKANIKTREKDIAFYAFQEEVSITIKYSNPEQLEEIKTKARIRFEFPNQWVSILIRKEVIEEFGKRMREIGIEEMDTDEIGEFLLDSKTQKTPETKTISILFQLVLPLLLLLAILAIFLLKRKDKHGVSKK